MRVFVGVFPPAEVRLAALQTIRIAARELGDRVRWTRPDNVHLTLKFLGEVEDERLEPLRSALREVCNSRAPFATSLNGYGAFPTARRARVVWAGTGVGSVELSDLAAEVEAALGPLGFGREERAFVPHATLGRVRGRPVRLDLLPAIPGEPGFEVTRVEVVRSKLSPGESVYEVLEGFELRGSKPA